jgi:hypothetical protein
MQSTTQKNKRLSERDRSIILSFARRQIEATEPHDALDAAYEAAAQAVADAVEVAFPLRDMKVLAKYGLADKDRCIYISAGGFGHMDEFCFREDDKRITLRPNRNCRHQPVMLEGDAGEALTAYKTAREAHKAATNVRNRDFSALVNNTTSFNSLVEIWPAVEALRGEIVGQSAALSTLSNETVERLKADPAFQMAEAA